MRDENCKTLQTRSQDGTHQAAGRALRSPRVRSVGPHSEAGHVQMYHITYLLGDLAAQLCAICFIGRVGVNRNDEMGKLPADKFAKRW